LNSPDFSLVNNSLPFDVSNNIPNLVPRFTAVVMSDIKVEPSLVSMKASLRRVGIKPINNIVDVTNYIMHLTGQPLHAFDYDKLIEISGSDTPILEPRLAKEGEQLELLGGKTVTLTNEDMVISASGKAVALAGVMGGIDTEVDMQTTRIVIECANFDMYTVRRTSMRHGLFTEAVTRFNKGQSPLQNDRIMYFTMNNMIQYFGARQASNVFDLCDFDLSADNLSHVDVSIDFLNDRLGANLEIEYVKSLLENVEFMVNVNENNLSVTAPFWRMDIALPEDILEEVGRLHGYDKLNASLPLRVSRPTPKNDLREFKNNIRLNLKQFGANEVLTYSFVHEKLMESSGIDAQKWAYHLRNAISPELQYYRTSLLPSILSKVHTNLKAQAGQSDNEFALYEIGKAHLKGHNEELEPALPKQMQRLALVVAVDEKTSAKYSGSPYYLARKYVDMLTNNQSSYIPLDTNEYPLSAPFQLGRSSIIVMGTDKKPIGVVGEFSEKTKKQLKLPNYCAGFELDIELLQGLVEPTIYQPLSKHPASSQDITFEVNDDKSWEDLNTLLLAELAVAKAEYGYNYSLSPLEIYKKEDSDKKRISFRIDLSHHDKTLRVEEINNLLDGIAKAIDEKFEAIRI
jgi:phenylalanyl-tRNA synthetase beta chain